MKSPDDALMPGLPRWMIPAVRFAGNVLDALRAVVPGVRRRDRVDKATEQEIIRLAAQEALDLSRDVIGLARERSDRHAALSNRDHERRAAEEMGFAHRPGSASDGRYRADVGSSRPGKAAEQDLARLSREVLGLSQEVLRLARERCERSMAFSDRDHSEPGCVPPGHLNDSTRIAKVREFAPLSFREAEEREMDELGFVPLPDYGSGGRHRADAGPARPGADTRHPRQREIQRDELEIGR